MKKMEIGRINKCRESGKRRKQKVKNKKKRKMIF